MIQGTAKDLPVSEADLPSPALKLRPYLFFVVAALCCGHQIASRQQLGLELLGLGFLRQEVEGQELHG